MNTSCGVFKDIIHKLTFSNEHTFLIIKFAMAAVAALIFRAAKKRNRKYIGMTLGAVAAELIMVAGYFLFESAIVGVGAAAAASLFNLLQGTVGAVVGAAAGILLDRGGVLKKLK